MLKRVLTFPIYAFAMVVLLCVWLVATPVMYIGKAVAEVTEHLRDVVFPREEGEQDD